MRRPLVVGLASLVAAAPARAAVVNYSNYCTVGSPFVTCASIRIFTATLPTGSSVDIRVRNLEGTHPLATIEGSLPGYGETILGYMAFSFPTQAAGFTYGTVGSVYGTADQLDAGWDGNRFETFPAIWGCDIDPAVGDIVDPNGLPGFQTCPRKGLNGWVSFRFDFATAIDPREVGVEWNDGIGSCTVTAQGAYGCAQGLVLASIATPEPSTYLLMLTGLLVVGGLQLRRRATR